jgi:hypothetical protein
MRILKTFVGARTSLDHILYNSPELVFPVHGRRVAPVGAALRVAFESADKSPLAYSTIMRIPYNPTDRAVTNVWKSSRNEELLSELKTHLLLWPYC